MEYLIHVIGQTELQITPDMVYRGQRNALSHFFTERAPSEFQYGNQLGGFSGPEPQCFGERGRGG